MVSSRTLLGFAIAQVAAVGIVAALGRFGGGRCGDSSTTAGANADLLILWLKAGLFGGVLAGALAWLVDLLPLFDLGDNSLLFELTSGAAWTALLIFVPAMVGVGIAHHLENRRESKAVSA